MAITGSTIKRLRIEAGLTQRQLAELIGISQAHVAKIEKETVDPRLSTVNKILEILIKGEGKKCSDVMTRNVISAKQSDTVQTVSRLMMRNAISQLPVIENGKVVGTVTEEKIVSNLSSTIADEKVEKIMQVPMPQVPEDTSISIIRPLLENNYGVLVTRKGEVIGIITRSDLLKVISKTI
jgi:predicted transcriptional regulator